MAAVLILMAASVAGWACAELSKYTQFLGNPWDTSTTMR